MKPRMLTQSERAWLRIDLIITLWICRVLREAERDRT